MFGAMQLPPYDSPTPAREALGSARTRAAAEGKRVAVVFGADWCPDCHALDAAFSHPLVEPIVERGFVVVKVDVGRRDKNLDLLAEHGMDVWKGIPAVAILEPDGTLLAAQREGEFRNARSLQPLEIVSFFHPFFQGG